MNGKKNEEVEHATFEAQSVQWVHIYIYEFKKF